MVKLFINSPLKLYFEDYLQVVTKDYSKKNIPPIDTNGAEVMHYLMLINQLSPELYTLIKATDPTGEKHILREEWNEGASAHFSEDGLPLLKVGADIIKQPIEQQRFIIGHELGHYALGHVNFCRDVYHKTMAYNDDTSADQKYSASKKVANQLPFEETFINAKSRINEFEADRFSVLTLRTNIDAALDWMNEYLEDYEEPEKETFKSTHPLCSGARMTHMKELKRELALQQSQGKAPKKINWNALAQEYKNLCKNNKSPKV